MQLLVISEIGSPCEEPARSRVYLSVHYKIESKGVRAILLRPKVNRGYQRYKRDTYLIRF